MTFPTAASAIKPLSKIPGPKLYPIVGNLPQYLFGLYSRFKYHEVLKHFRQTYGPVVKENLGGRLIVHVFDPEDIKKVYAQEGKYPVIPPLQETTQIYREQKQMSLGLGFTNGEEWYRLRSNLQQRILRPKEVQQHLPGVNKVAQDFVQRLDQLRYSRTNEINNLATEMGRWSLENAALIVLDKRLGCFDFGSEQEAWAAQMVKANRAMFTYSGILKLSFPFYRYVSTPKWKKLVAAEDLLYNSSIRMIDEAILRFREEVESGGLDVNPHQFYILSYLLSRSELSLKDVTVLCLSMLLDGLSTTTPTMLFNLYCLATNPHLQDKVFQEVDAVVGREPFISPNHINELKYLKAFIKETFRLWPNGTEVSRYLDKDLVLQDYHIPAGTHVDLNPLVHFRDPSIFPEPDVHIPERWLRDDPNEKNVPEQGLQPDLMGRTSLQELRQSAAQVHSHLLTPFGHGTRMCAGRRFAEQDLIVMLATLVRTFRMSYVLGEAVNMSAVYNTLLFPDRCLRIKFEPRT